MASISVLRSRLIGGPFKLLRAASRSSLIALGVGLAALISGILTYLTITGLTPYNPTPAGMVVLIVVDLSLVLALAGLIAWRLTRLWTERRSGAAGSKLHLRLVAMFSAIAVVPAILVAIFAAISLNLGIEAWFSERVQTALANSVSVADAYVEEHKQVIRGDILAMADDLNRASPLVQGDQKRIVEILETEAKLRALPGVYVIDSTGADVATAKLRSMPDRGPVTPEQIEQAKSGQVVVLADSNEKAVSALVRLNAFADAYLLVTRAVDPQVLEHQRRTQDAVSEYQRLNQNRSEIQLTFAVLYVVVAMLILLAAVWLALWAASRIVHPIGRLAGAAERVSEGDLGVRVDVGADDDEIGALSETFNRMTSQLEGQRKELVDANFQLDARRRFTEAMLAGVSAGVVGLDGEGHITLINRMASRMLNAVPEDIEGRHYSECMPELAGLIRRAITEPTARASGQVDVRRDGALRHLNVQVSSEAGDKTHGFVVTFDDITDLVSAQRTAAWADVARRIAHEIKNPLTPIQLSAERLKRKYAKEVSSDPEVFAQCTDTIIRQVGDIGRMVDEFSSFARMPAPVIRTEEAQELVRHAVFLQRVAQPQIAFEVTAPAEPIRFDCDGRLVSQALLNVMKNAAEAIAARHATGDTEPGRIALDLSVKGNRLIISAQDNGVGLPAENRHRLTEPYVTTRAKGTGLGLAIVRKILEDHGGELLLEDAARGLSGEIMGAVVRMVFPLRRTGKTEQGFTHETERVAGIA
ncbi:MAG TPA: PAS domain-containing sensor histidine kinase [Micropepsaceae bacterium]|jgi:two-component system nitrogen regulation sensor histidine kinase NtrY|nr:PAS domain-containing sensor histidine kinase [Micropepsaceae bacterium]